MQSRFESIMVDYGMPVMEKSILLFAIHVKWISTRMVLKTLSFCYVLLFQNVFFCSRNATVFWKAPIRHLSQLIEASLAASTSRRRTSIWKRITKRSSTGQIYQNNSKSKLYHSIFIVTNFCGAENHRTCLTCLRLYGAHREPGDTACLTAQQCGPHFQFNSFVHEHAEFP